MSFKYDLNIPLVKENENDKKFTINLYSDACVHYPSDWREDSLYVLDECGYRYYLDYNNNGDHLFNLKKDLKDSEPIKIWVDAHAKSKQLGYRHEKRIQFQDPDIVRFRDPIFNKKYSHCEFKTTITEGLRKLEKLIRNFRRFIDSNGKVHL